MRGYPHTNAVVWGQMPTTRSQRKHGGLWHIETLPAATCQHIGSHAGQAAVLWMAGVLYIFKYIYIHTHIHVYVKMLKKQNFKNKNLKIIPSYLGGWDWEDHGSRSKKKKRKSLQDPISTAKRVGLVVHPCHPSYSRKHKIRGSWFQAGLGKKQDLISKIITAKRTGSSGNTPAWQAWSPEFKPTITKKMAWHGASNLSWS
jgi:hypothetical protein